MANGAKLHLARRMTAPAGMFAPMSAEHPNTTPAEPKAASGKLQPERESRSGEGAAPYAAGRRCSACQTRCGDAGMSK